MQLFEVGGCVRDEILGVPSKDIDFTVVLDPTDQSVHSTDPYGAMVNRLSAMGVRIIRDDDGKPIGANFLTARGIAPKDFPVHPGRALDFVLARKESDYTDGRRPDKVKPGTLMDDLARRDFTMNAIAKGTDGSLIDPFNGVADIEARIIRAVGDPMERLTEDALRAVRAVRFAVTKNFTIETGLSNILLWETNIHEAIVNNVSDERIAVELQKMFRYDTPASLRILAKYPLLTSAIFAGSVSLDATMKQRGRG